MKASFICERWEGRGGEGARCGPCPFFNYTWAFALKLKKSHIKLGEGSRAVSARHISVEFVAILWAAWSADLHAISAKDSGGVDQ